MRGNSLNDATELFLPKLAPPIEQVDSGSGGIGSKGDETSVPIIAKADVCRLVRHKWLDRLWDALQEDDMPYLEYLGERWGERADDFACVQMS